MKVLSKKKIKEHKAADNSKVIMLRLLIEGIPTHQYGLVRKMPSGKIFTGALTSDYDRVLSDFNAVVAQIREELTIYALKEVAEEERRERFEQDRALYATNEKWGAF